MKALLSKEADAIKRDGEKGPDLGVKSVWNVEAVDMVEQPGNAPNPWRGSVRMLIVTRNQGVGEVQEDRIAKTFDFVYDAAGKRWLMEYKPK